MIFVFNEEHNLDVVENKEVACSKYPGLALDSGYYVFYDEDGNYLSPHFIVPNRRIGILNFFGIFFWDKNGEYELYHDPEISKREDPIWYMLSDYEGCKLNPNKYFQTLEELKTYLRAKGVIVDKPISPKI